MNTRGVTIYQNGKVLWKDVTGELDEQVGTFTIRDAKGIPTPGADFELELADGRKIAMRSGAPKTGQRISEGTTAYFSLCGSWKLATNT